MPRSPNPLLPVPRALIESIVVEIAGVEHRARAAGRKLEVTGATVSTTWVKPVSPVAWEARVGERVPAFLAQHVPADERDLTLAAAVVVAAVLGHPRRDARGHRIQFVWTDHVALACGIPVRRAFEVSHVKTAQGAFIRELDGRVQARVAQE